MPSRTPDEKGRAIARLSRERQVRLTDLAGLPVVVAGVEYRPAVATLIRWGTEGKGGVFLDVLRCSTRRAWVTSRAALGRFAAEVEAATSGASTPLSPTAPQEP